MTTSTPSRAAAIKYALDNKWEEAYRENLKLLEENPDDLETINRIGYSLIRLGKFRKAREYYQKVISIDKTNPIATKNLKRLETMSKRNFKKPDGQAQISNIQDVYIEEAGKTKTVELKNVADKKTLLLLETGEGVILLVKRSKVFVQMPNKTFIGMLPDNIGMRMITFINGGNEYSACIKAVEENSVTVFIREIKKMAKFTNMPSFVHTPLTNISSDEDR